MSEKNDKVEQRQADIEQGVAELVEGEDWRGYLEVIARFPRYSARNALLIRLQFPTATLVAGYKKLQTMGLQVRAGERSIKILAPCTYRAKPQEDDDEAEPGRVLRGFRIAHVFDVSQCDGDRPELPRAALLEGEAPAGLWDALAAQVRTAGFTLERAPIPGSANGTTDFAAWVVTVDAGLSPEAAAKTVCHELAHARLHTGAEYAMGCRGRAEVEAESVAFVVCQAAGLSTAGYSFGYVAGWSGGETKVIRETAERVVSCAREILDRAGLLEPAEQREAA